MAKIGVGVIGCGDIASVRYFPSIEALPQLVLKAVHSRNSATCGPIAARYGARYYGDLDAFLENPEVEAVIVATPHPSHAELTIRALDAGKHVLAEKPMATSLADAARVREAAERSGRVFMALPFDDFPPMQEARRLIGSGAIGRVNSADAVLAHQGPVHASWFFDREKAGWGVLADLGVYLISQLTYVLGPAESVAGRTATFFPERTSPEGKTFRATVEDNVAAVIAWPGNILGTFRANWCSAADKRNVIWETRIYGTAGIVFINLASTANPLVVYAPKRAIDGADKIVHTGMTDCYRPDLPAWDQHRDVLQSFAGAIEGNRAGAVGGSSAARQHHIIEIIASLYESSNTGRTIGLASRY